MPDKAQTVWALIGKGNKLTEIFPEEPKKNRFPLKKIKIHFHIANKRGMGRSKGNALERDAAEAFSLWIFGKPKYMKRTPLSGGWASGKAGDIILDHEIARKKGIREPAIYVECRNYKDILQHDVLTWPYYGVPETFTKWIKEVEKKCDGRLPFLVLKGKGTREWVMISWLWLTRQTLTVIANLSREVRVRRDGSVYYIFPLERLASRLGEGKQFLRQWREDDGPAELRRHCRGS